MLRRVPPFALVTPPRREVTNEGRQDTGRDAPRVFAGVPCSGKGTRGQPPPLTWCIFKLGVWVRLSVVVQAVEIGGGGAKANNVLCVEVC
jgi:hypothetical protein